MWFPTTRPVACFIYILLGRLLFLLWYCQIQARDTTGSLTSETGLIFWFDLFSSSAICTVSAKYPTCVPSCSPTAITPHTLSPSCSSTIRNNAKNTPNGPHWLTDIYILREIYLFLKIIQTIKSTIDFIKMGKEGRRSIHTPYILLSQPPSLSLSPSSLFPVYEK